MKVTVWHLFQTLIEDLQISTGNKYETEIERKAALSLYFEKKILYEWAEEHKFVKGS